MRNLILATKDTYCSTVLGWMAKVSDHAILARDSGHKRFLWDDRIAACSGAGAFGLSCETCEASFLIALTMVHADTSHEAILVRSGFNSHAGKQRFLDALHASIAERTLRAQSRTAWARVLDDDGVV